jgi:hypothetical protein
MSFMERVTPVVDDTIKALAKTKFLQDPVAGTKYSRATSIVSSAYAFRLGFGFADLVRRPTASR